MIQKTFFRQNRRCTDPSIHTVQAIVRAETQSSTHQWKKLQKQENVEKWQYIVTELFILWGYFKFILFGSNCDYKKIICSLFVVFWCPPAAVFSLIVEAIESLYQLVLRSQFEIFLVQFQRGNCIFLQRDSWLESYGRNLKRRLLVDIFHIEHNLNRKLSSLYTQSPYHRARST